MASWEKRKDEPVEAYMLFERYVHGERSIASIAQDSGHSLAYVEDLGKLYNWEQRATDYDSSQLVQQIADVPEIISSKEMTIVHMTAAHMQLAQKARNVASYGFTLLQKYMAEVETAKLTGEKPPARPAVNPENLVKLAEFAIKNERLALGEATSITQTKKADYSKLSSDKLEMLEKLLAEAEDTDEDH